LRLNGKKAGIFWKKRENWGIAVAGATDTAKSATDILLTKSWLSIIIINAIQEVAKYSST
jgi:uncharacterized protein (UPF0548 family)